MTNDNGWIKISRKILDWEWYDNPIVKCVFLHLILTANIKAASWHGMTIERGQLVTSYGKIAVATGHSVQEVRTAIKKLKSTGCITQSEASKSSLFTVINYDTYQSPTQSSTGNQQATNNNQRNKEIKNERMEEINTPLPPTGECGGESNAQIQGESLKVKTAGGKRSHSTTLEDDENFKLFWAAYPKRVSKQAALNAWAKLKPDRVLTQKMLDSLEQQKKTAQWTKDDGQFIPYPATWLNGRKWEDEINMDIDKIGGNEKEDKNGTGYSGDYPRSATAKGYSNCATNL